MKILVLGGTRFFGIHTVNELIKKGHNVTIATRGNIKDSFGNAVKRIIVDRTDEKSMKNAFVDIHYDVVIDKIGYCSNDIKYAMEAIDCDKYIYMSTTAVYEPKHMNTKESEFNGLDMELVWCSRSDFPYEIVKRFAEGALWQKYADRKWIVVRYPFVIGKDDYTKRLQFYIEHTVKGIPMNIDNLDFQMGYIFSDDAGKFMSFLADKDFTGAVNGSTKGTISLAEIIEYTEKRTGTKAIISKDGEVEYSINTDIAESMGFEFSKLKDRIYNLIDYYIANI